MTERRSDFPEPAEEAPTKIGDLDSGRSVAGRRVGRYRLVEKLGAGGMGEVYRAHDTQLGRDVAIKVLLTLGDPAARKRLWREARAAASLNHPNVCQPYEIGDEHGEPFLAMELLNGESLATSRDPWLDTMRAAPDFTKALRLAETRHHEALTAFRQADGDRLLGLRVAQ